MYPGVELRLYRYVAVLAEELNFTRAAARLHVAQPSLSKHIRELESYLGAQLFEPTKRDVRLTAAGEAFTAEARLTLGFRLAQPYWAKGLATEAASAWIRAAFDDFHINRLIALVHPENVASIRVLEKLS